MGKLSEERLVSLTAALDHVFELLAGPYANLFTEGEELHRPLRIKFTPREGTAVVLEWSVGTAMNIAALKVSLTSQTGGCHDVDSISIQSNSDSWSFAGFKTNLLSDLVSDGRADRAVIEIEAKTTDEVLIEKLNGGNRLPNDFKVSVTAADGSTEVVYDHASIYSKFIDHIAAIEVCERFPPHIWSSMIACLEPMLMQDYKATRAPFRRLRKQLGPEAYTSIGESLNRHWLVARNHEYSQHGASYTFRYWTDDEKTDLLMDIKKLCDELARVGIESCICYGTLLGFVRENDFIPHDDDADILCFNHDRSFSLPDFLQKLRTMAERSGMSIVKVSKGNGFICMLTGTGRAVDFFICDVYDQECHVHPAKHKPTSYHAFFPLQERKALGVDLPFPNHPESVLHDIYGDSWETPVPFFMHDWQRSA